MSSSADDKRRPSAAAPIRRYNICEMFLESGTVIRRSCENFLYWY